MNDKTTIGNFVDIVFVQFNNNSISAKVDTGATMSSLDARDIKIFKQGGSNFVSFVSSVLSNNVIKLPLVEQQEINSADGGVVTREVIAVDIIVAGVKLENIEFNLNDRSDMDCPILIGQNILSTGNFIIDPDQSDNQQNETTIDQKNIIEQLQLLQQSLPILLEQINQMLTNSKNE